MNESRPKIALYAKRSFGDKMNITIAFIRENWKPLLKYLTYFILPVCLVQSLSLNKFMANTIVQATTKSDTMPDIWFFVQYGSMFLLYLIGYILTATLVYTMMKTYSNREERLSNITMNMMKPLFFHHLLRVIITILVLIVVFAAFTTFIILLGMASPFTLIITIPALLFMIIPATLFTPTYLFEDISLGQAITKTCRIGYRTWGGTFLIGLIMGIFAYIVQIVMSLPWYISFMINTILGINNGNQITTSVGFSFMLYLFGIILTFGNYLSTTLILIGFSYQYGHASEAVDNVTIDEDIEKFDTLQ
jgi:hypothetical protein